MYKVSDRVKPPNAQLVTTGSPRHDGTTLDVWLTSVAAGNGFTNHHYDFVISDREFSIAYVHTYDLDDLIINPFHTVLERAFKNVDPEQVDFSGNTFYNFRYMNRNVNDETKEALKDQLSVGNLVIGISAIFQSQAYSSAESKQIKSAENHLKQFKDDEPNTPLEVQMFLDPLNMRRGRSNYEFYKFFEYATASEISSATSREFLHRIYSALSSTENDENLLRDVEIKPLSALTWDHKFFETITNLPFSSTEYREFLLNHKVGDVRRLLGRTKKSAKAAEAIQLSQVIINCGLEPRIESVDHEVKLAYEAYGEALFKLHKERRSSMAEMNETFLNESGKMASVQLVKDYFAQLDTTGFDTAQYDFLFSLVPALLTSPKVAQNKASKWIDSPSYADVVIEILSVKKSVVEIVELLTRLMKEETKLSVQHWLQYADDPETFEVMPVAWWKEMV